MAILKIDVEYFTASTRVSSKWQFARWLEFAASDPRP